MNAALLIENGTVIDGTGRDPYPASVFIENGKIAAIGVDADKRAVHQRRVEKLDVKGMTVMPGLIDTHCHLAFDDAGSNSEMRYVMATDTEIVLSWLNSVPKSSAVAPAIRIARISYSSP